MKKTNRKGYCPRKKTKSKDPRVQLLENPDAMIK